MTVVLLDSNVIINSLKHDDTAAANFLEQHSGCCSVISVSNAWITTG